MNDEKPHIDFMLLQCNYRATLPHQSMNFRFREVVLLIQNDLLSHLKDTEEIQRQIEPH